MKKLFCAVALCLGAAMNAHAGYIEYDLSGPGVDNSIYGNSFIVIRDEDKSVAFYSVGNFRPNDLPDTYHQDFLTGSSSNFWGLGVRNMFWGIGPTNITVTDIWPEDWISMMSIDFAQGDSPTTFNYTMRVTTKAVPIPYPDLVFPTYHYTYTGTAVQVPTSEFVANILDGNNQYQYFALPPHIVPTQNVPEPGSLALFALGAIGVGRFTRRKA
jgi:hypothetical protein